uniref:Uncharacterized protein n=1 Tax=Physcomitrium patens TaxID=3218 RepID=A0A2K1KZY6_PHYPA|nr:hypothetical protein PHYPA_002136 [Physcomitrium patens]
MNVWMDGYVNGTDTSFTSKPCWMQSCPWMDECGAKSCVIGWFCGVLIVGFLIYNRMVLKITKK